MSTAWVWIRTVAIYGIIGFVYLGLSITMIGGFQFEFVSIGRVINHMTCYNSSALIDGKF